MAVSAMVYKLWMCCVLCIYSLPSSRFGPCRLCSGRRRQMLNAFVEDYANDLIVGASLNLRDFRAFAYRLPDVVRKSVQPVLQKRESIA